MIRKLIVILALSSSALAALAQGIVYTAPPMTTATNVTPGGVALVKGDILAGTAPNTLGVISAGTINLPLVSTGPGNLPGYAVLSFAGGGTGGTSFNSGSIPVSNGSVFTQSGNFSFSLTNGMLTLNGSGGRYGAGSGAPSGGYASGDYYYDQAIPAHVIQSTAGTVRLGGTPSNPTVADQTITGTSETTVNNGVQVVWAANGAFDSKTIEFYMSGTYNVTATHTLTVKMRADGTGGTSLGTVTLTMPSTVNGGAFVIHSFLTCQGSGAGANLQYQPLFNFTNTVATPNIPAQPVGNTLTALNMTSSHTFNPTIQWGSTGDTLVVKMAIARVW